MIFERKIYKKLLEWKNESHGQTALLIKGARRVGKSTVAQEFGKNEYESFVAIDFAIFRLFIFGGHLFLALFSHIACYAPSKSKNNRLDIKSKITQNSNELFGLKM